jgi:G3E family GTPase
MRMKADIEIVTGFIGAGKTSFINALIEETLVENENIVIIQCEVGGTEIKESIRKDKRITVRMYNPEKQLTEEYVKDSLNLCYPHRVIIEANGTRVINELLDILNKKSISGLCRLTTIFHIAEAATFHLFLNNMGNFLVPSIQLSNLILINNTDFINKEELQSIKSKINNINQHGHVIEVKQIEELKASIKQAKVLDKGIVKKCRTYLRNFIFKQ